VLLLSDPSVAAVPIRECGEALVDLHERGGLLVDARKRLDSAGAWAQLRAGVLTRLMQADAALPAGVRLLLIEGYRPPQLQQRYFAEYRQRLQTAHPDWTDRQLDAEASKYVSPPAVAPHSCGAAIDLTLWADGAELDLGTPINASPLDSDNACFTAADNIGFDARERRNLLIDALSGVGLVNYPTEWWHWSYGDRYWAVATGAPAALFGPV